MVRGTTARGRFKYFVLALIALACILVGGYIVFSHPGDPQTDVKPLDTSSVSLHLNAA